MSVFDGPDQVQINRVAEAFGTRFAATTALAAIDLCRDDSISPRALAAGLLLAHVKGLASAIHSATMNGELEVKVAHIANALFDQLETMMGARN